MPQNPSGSEGNKIGAEVFLSLRGIFILLKTILENSSVFRIEKDFIKGWKII